LTALEVLFSQLHQAALLPHPLFLAVDIINVNELMLVLFFKNPTI
jgi:hypothetical protein